MDEIVDEAKIMEGRKTSMRKSVQQAFERAICHKNQVASENVCIEEEGGDENILEENGFN